MSFRSLDDVRACLGPSPSGQKSRLVVAMCEGIQVGEGGGIWLADYSLALAPRLLILDQRRSRQMD